MPLPGNEYWRMLPSLVIDGTYFFRMELSGAYPEHFGFLAPGERPGYDGVAGGKAASKKKKPAAAAAVDDSSDEEEAKKPAKKPKARVVPGGGIRTK